MREKNSYKWNLLFCQFITRWLHCCDAEPIPYPVWNISVGLNSHPKPDWRCRRPRYCASVAHTGCSCTRVASEAACARSAGTPKSGCHPACTSEWGTCRWEKCRWSSGYACGARCRSGAWSRVAEFGAEAVSEPESLAWGDSMRTIRRQGIQKKITAWMQGEKASIISSSRSNDIKSRYVTWNYFEMQYPRLRPRVPCL